MFSSLVQLNVRSQFQEGIKYPGEEPYCAVCGTANFNKLLWHLISLLSGTQLQARSSDTSAKRNATGTQNDVVFEATEKLHYQSFLGGFSGRSCISSTVIDNNCVCSSRVLLLLLPFERETDMYDYTVRLFLVRVKPGSW